MNGHMPKADTGLIGLAVMEKNLALKTECHGFRVAVYNRSPHKTPAVRVGRIVEKRFVTANPLKKRAQIRQRYRPG